MKGSRNHWAAADEYQFAGDNFMEAAFLNDDAGEPEEALSYVRKAMKMYRLAHAEYLGNDKKAKKVLKKAMDIIKAFAKDDKTKDALTAALDGK